MDEIDCDLEKVYLQDSEGILFPVYISPEDKLKLEEEEEERGYFDSVKDFISSLGKKKHYNTNVPIDRLL